MIDLAAVHLALRNRALSVVVAATGAATLAATSTGYTRAAGSFVTDGFLPGMELDSAGFAVTGNNGAHVITAVAALTLTCTGCAADPAAAARTLTVGLPALRSFENVTLTPVTGRPYFDEDFVPATSELLSFPAAGGTVEEDGLYMLKVYGLPNKDILALRKVVHALALLFTPGTVLTAGSGTVRVRGGSGPMSGGSGPQTGQIIPLTNHAVLILTVPWRAYSVNVIAA